MQLAVIDFIALNLFIASLRHATNLGTIESMAAHSEGVLASALLLSKRTACERSSGENLLDFLLMAQSSQRKEPHQNTALQQDLPQPRQRIKDHWF